MNNWIKGEMSGENLVKNGPGYIGYLPFLKLVEIMKSI
jgi:hypothetical protein